MGSFLFLPPLPVGDSIKTYTAFIGWWPSNLGLAKHLPGSIQHQLLGLRFKVPPCCATQHCYLKPWHPYVCKHDQTEENIIGVGKFTLDHIVVYWFLCHPTQLFSEPIIAVPRSQIILIYIASTNLDYNSSINILLLLWKQTTSQQSFSGHGSVGN